MNTQKEPRIQDSTLLLFVAAAGLMAVFTIFTLLVLIVDVGGIGPYGARVGFSTLNGSVRDAIGWSRDWYAVSEWLGLLAILTVACFAGLGVWQMIRRKSLLKVDAAIWLLGGLYVLMAGAYLLFEVMVVNQRPILIDGVLEASYPSSHTMLVCTVMGSAIFAVRQIFTAKAVRVTVTAVASVVMLATVVTRLLSGVHWLTDIIGGVLLAAFLVSVYVTVLAVVKDLRGNSSKEAPQETPQAPETNG